MREIFALTFMRVSKIQGRINPKGSGLIYIYIYLYWTLNGDTRSLDYGSLELLVIADQGLSATRWLAASSVPFLILRELLDHGRSLLIADLLVVIVLHDPSSSCRNHGTFFSTTQNRSPEL